MLFSKMYMNSVCAPVLDVIECASSPCMNGGVCQQEEVNQYSCVCPAGLTGTQCQTGTEIQHKDQLYSQSIKTHVKSHHCVRPYLFSLVDSIH